MRKGPGTTSFEYREMPKYYAYWMKNTSDASRPRKEAYAGHNRFRHVACWHITCLMESVVPGAALSVD
jgi:hypothetical protein